MGKKYKYPRLKHIWYGMRDRCKRGSYKKKGIKVCDEWQTFKNFEKWALEHGYEEPKENEDAYDRLSVDRIDSSGDYTPDNCQWMTRRNNSRKRDKIMTDFDTQKAAEQIVSNCTCFKKEKQRTTAELEQALSHIKIIAESPKNFDYWRVLVEALKHLYNQEVER